ncbi:unnamed protein product [Thlaspi arvense]|uniref:3'-5' exonuclease domain-containing protein n=1 Tax=Thlaspi arvense TaxID=13288 RepID=A0AAU9S3B2_THLAR|nr:unnamed protein product [Thlaspi arvense]
MAPTIETVAIYNSHQEHSVDFFGMELIVTVTPTASVISQWISNVLYNNSARFFSHPLVVGVGVQWTADDPHSSPPGDSYYADPSPPRYYVDPPADTLQLSVGNECLIIQLSYCDDVPDELRSFLTDPQTTYVGVRNSQDARKLATCRHRLQMGELLDIRNYVRDSQGCHMRGRSFEAIFHERMGFQGVRLDPEISRSDWSVYELSDEQILQASLDVCVCAKLGVWERLWEV